MEVKTYRIGLETGIRVEYYEDYYSVKVTSNNRDILFSMLARQLELIDKWTSTKQKDIPEVVNASDNEVVIKFNSDVNMAEFAVWMESDRMRTELLNTLFRLKKKEWGVMKFIKFITTEM